LIVRNGNKKVICDFKPTSLKVMYSQNIQNSSNHLIELDYFLLGVYFIQLSHNKRVGKPVKLVVTH